MKRDQKFAFASSSSHEWFDMANENSDFDKGKDANVVLFWYVIVVTI